MLEQQPLETVANSGELEAYRHEGFWHYVDTKRDLDAGTSMGNSRLFDW